MRYKNVPFKKSIRDELTKKPQVNSEETEIKVPSTNDIKKLWWSKYKPDLKNPETHGKKSLVNESKKTPSKS